jgi:hypothetical protein
VVGWRERREQRIADERLPAGARKVAVEGVKGWLYEVKTRWGDAYELFAWFDGSAWQVRVVSPDLWGRDDLHQSHLFPDARICLGKSDGAGMPSLESAFTQSVAWADGFSEYRRTGRFPY